MPIGTLYSVPKVVLVCKGVRCDNTFTSYTTQNKKYCSPKCRYGDKNLATVLGPSIDNKHFLSEIDPINKVAICSVCGLIDIRERTEERKYSKNVKWRCKGSVRARSWAKKYGLSSFDIISLLNSQKGLCSICSKDIKKDFNVDHCHNSNIVRGLLCRNCNTGIGLLQEDPILLKKAIDYIEKHRDNKT